jgi:N-acetylglucosamine-6-phosphate deacetylase
MRRLIRNAWLILPDRLARGALAMSAGRIEAILEDPACLPPADLVEDLQGWYLSPGFVDLHVHGGAGADFMDGTAEAFLTICRGHARHGTTSLVATSTVARPEQTLRFLALCDAWKEQPTGGARVLGAHLYGPFFAPEARGCHPAAPLHLPDPAELQAYLAFAPSILTASIAPEIPGAEAFARALRGAGVRLNIGHSLAAFEQVSQARSWGAAHVDHLFCAMSDRARLRSTQPYPMRGGVVEATLFFDDLTTEVIADGKHLAGDLLRLAYKIKGPDRLALVTDCNRALDMPDGLYLFGPRDGGEPILKRDGVGLLPDGQSLASSVVGMDHMVRTFHRLTGAPLPEVVRMASLTPARILGKDGELGSLTVGKRADLVALDADLAVRRVWLDGEPILRT